MMDFKGELINQIKSSPDVFNEIRVEALVDRLNAVVEGDGLSYIDDPNQDNTLEDLSDEELINSIIRNLQYYITYERELGESDL
ncbi:hypothetical protein BX659_10247 [Orenia metallireducens]|jgi:hypothetical protein|uniref:Uncharacterized protein n=1 Tax=Orenia metallireducens TaxID=1413210 RepID=A0A285F279_9FIRM|nr:hypothetical protein [Orenia metallireducens]PRX34732.1 hypothetical protein BX659_10247 [Orenia metallireducens]SNY05395.1 hypothetical protein SAMN06265827_10147 [Orenia metallireducens]